MYGVEKEPTHMKININHWYRTRVHAYENMWMQRDLYKYPHFTKHEIATFLFPSRFLSNSVPYFALSLIVRLSLSAPLNTWTRSTLHLFLAHLIIHTHIHTEYKIRACVCYRSPCGFCERH